MTTAIQDDLLSFLPTPRDAGSPSADSLAADVEVAGPGALHHPAPRHGDHTPRGEVASLTPSPAHPAELLDAVADHWLPSRQDDRALIEAAIDEALRRHGEVHISLVRLALARLAGDREVEPHMLGAVISAWATRHGEHVGWRPNGDTKSGNGAKPARVWKAKEAA